jgi:hypothetical protein
MGLLRRVVSEFLIHVSEAAETNNGVAGMIFALSIDYANY